VRKEIDDMTTNTPDPESRDLASLVDTVTELMDVLETIENDDGKIPDWLWARIRAVIAKAKGAV
jgi:hypothetical protein